MHASPVVASLLLALCCAVAHAAITPLTLGARACPTPTATCSGCRGVASYVAMSYTAPPYTFFNASQPRRQLLAAPFNLTGEGDLFEVRAFNFFYGTSNPTGLQNKLVGFLWNASTANQDLPGQAFPTNGLAFSSVTAQSTVFNTNFYEFRANLTQPFNVTSGIYLVGAGYINAVPGTGTGSDPNTFVANQGPLTTAQYVMYAGGENAIDGYGISAPGDVVFPDFQWGNLAPNASVRYPGILCVWVTGTLYPGPSGTTTTGGGDTTTTTTTTTTGGGESTTTGGSGGDDTNPTNFLVRYTLETDLNAFNPQSFASKVEGLLGLEQFPSSRLFISSARRAEVQQAKRATTAGTLVDFYVSGEEFGPSLMNDALAFNVTQLRSSGIPATAAPVAVDGNDCGSASSVRSPLFALRELLW